MNIIKSDFFGRMISNKIENSTVYLKRLSIFLLFFLLIGLTGIHAQVEDTTKTERDLPERLERFESPYQAPYQFDIPESEINRYQLDDYGTLPGFYRRLKYQEFEDYLMSEEERYDPYGDEWVQKINQDLIVLLELTFKEENEFLSAISRIGRFLTAGFFEPYEVPITRIDDPDRSHIENGNHEY